MSKQTDFVKKYFNDAMTADLNTGVNYLFLLAQAALETGWGEKAIGNNLFGITKGKNWTGKVQKVLTTEYFDNEHKIIEGVKYTGVAYYSTRKKKTRYKFKPCRTFRDYNNVTECFEDHFKILLKPHFAHAFKFRNEPKEFVKAIQGGKLKYATGEKYASTICTLIDQIDRIIEKEKLIVNIKG